MSWDVVDFDFGGEETINFGPRQESGSALYQIDTLATISSSSEDIHTVPVTRCTVQGDLACIAVESHLSAFKDCQHMETIGFDAVIDEIEWSPDESMIFLGCRTGMLYVLDAETQDILFDFTVLPASSKGNTFSKIICCATKEENFDLVILGHAGVMMLVKDLNRNIFVGSVENKAETAGQIKKKLSRVKTMDVHTEAVYDVVKEGETILTLGAGDSVLAVWKRGSDAELQLVDETPSLFESQDCAMVQGQISSDGNCLFALNSNGSISLWNTSMLLLLESWSDLHVLEFQLLETRDLKNYSLQDMKLVLLTSDKDNKVNLIIKSAPTFDVVYKLQLHAPSTIAKCPAAQETLYIAECCPNENFPGTVSNVRFRCLTETNPETRLSRILYKNQFEEAVKFAKMYKLEMELVYKVKISFLLDQLSPWNVRKYDEVKVENMISQIWESLEFVKDDQHIYEILIKSAFPKLEDTEKILAYCKKRLVKTCSEQSKDIQAASKEKLQLLLVKVQQVQDRMVTFKMAYGGEYSGENWERFMEADLLEESLLNMKQGRTQAGVVIWTRHDSEWKDVIKSEMLERFLAFIPSSMRTMDVLTVVRDTIIPYTVCHLPKELKSVVKWIIQWATSMELKEKNCWPGNALHFLRSLLRSLSSAIEIKDSEICSQMDIINKTKLQTREILEPVQNLISSLQHLSDLHSKYKCSLTFGQFCQETTESVTFRMLDMVVAVELIQQTLERQIRPYMREHNLKEDTIFSKYVKDFLERSGRVTSYIGAPWETKVLAVINCISNPQQKLTAILEMIDYAPIPWTVEVEKVVQRGLHLDHSLVKDLQKQVNMVRVKKLMLKYGLHGVPEKDNCFMLANYILRHDKEEAMEDALNVMKAFNMDFTVDLYLFRMRALIKDDKLDECFSLLRGLPLHIAQTCCRRMLCFVELLLDSTIEYDQEASHKEKRAFTEAGIAIARQLLDNSSDFLEQEKLEEQMFELQKIKSLQRGFDMFLTLKQYRCKEYRKNVLVKFMTTFYSKTASDPEKRNYAKVYSLANILQISPVEMQGKLAIQAAKTGQIQRAIQITSKLFESDPTHETAETLYQVALVFLKLYSDIDEESVNMEELRDLPSLTYKLLCQAQTICSPNLLSKCLELSNYAYLNMTVGEQCEAGDFNTSMEEDKKERMQSYLDIAKDWTADSLFKEDALVMNSRAVLPLVSSYCAANSEFYQQEAHNESTMFHPLTRMAAAVLPVVQYTKENSHHQLAYQFTQQSLNTSTESIWKKSYGNLLQTSDMAEQIEEQTAERELLNEIESRAQPTLKDCIFNVLMKMFNCTFVDHKLALSYLLSRSKKESMSTLLKIINTCGQNYKKMKAIATVGIALANIYQEPSAMEYCMKLEKNATWGHRLGKMKISFKEVFQEVDTRKMDLLPQIAQCETANVCLVEEYCKAFGLDVDMGLMTYLDHVFNEMHQSYVYNSAVHSSRRNRMKNARMAVKAITQKAILTEKLNNLYFKTSSYDYETIEFLLEEMQNIEDDSARDKKLDLLGYLKPYTRISEPTEYELKYGLDKKSDDLQILPSLPSESKVKLPFHPLAEGDPWQIITPELKKETVQTWLEIAKLLKLNPDQIHIMCIKSMVKNHANAVKQSDLSSGDSSSDKAKWNWDIKDANTSLLVNIETLLQQLTSCETALACANWVVRELPLGAERVLGLKGCMKMAKLWYETAAENTAVMEKAKRAYIKFLTVWRRLATEQVLFTHKMCDADLLQLVGDAEKLIIKLYEHPSILTASKEGHIADIHSIAEEIGHIYEINVNDIRLSLIEKWLPSSSSKQSESESTVTFSFDALKLAQEAPNSEDDDDNLQRVIYLLREGNQEKKLAVKIFTFAFSNDITNECQQVTNMCRVRALRCLLQLGNEEMIQNLCADNITSLEDLRYLLKITMYLVDLEKIHILQSVATFEDSNKEGLVRGIWRNHSHQRSACLLVASLCLDYGIHDRKLWNNVLQQLLTFCMYKELEIVLLRLQSIPDVWQIQVYPKVWQAILANPLTTVVPPLGEEQMVNCIQVFNLMKRCPVIDDLDLLSLSQHFHRLDMATCAFLCLHMSKNGEVKEKEYISSHSIRILENAQTLQQNGMDSWVVRETEDLVFNHMLNNEDFLAIAQSKFKSQMVMFAIQSGKIDGLLKFTVHNSLFKEGEMLLKQYLMVYPSIQQQLDIYLSKYFDDDSESNFPLMQYYLRMQNLTEVANLL